MSWEAWIILGWWIWNFLLYVVLIGRTLQFTVASAVVAAPTYVFLVWLLLRLVGVL